MSNKFEIKNKKWIVKTGTQNGFPTENAIKISSITEVDIYARTIRLYAGAKVAAFIISYTAKEKEQFETELKLLKALIYK